jgi:hypothetical protein
VNFAPKADGSATGIGSGTIVTVSGSGTAAAVVTLTGGVTVTNAGTVQLAGASGYKTTCIPSQTGPGAAVLALRTAAAMT